MIDSGEGPIQAARNPTIRPSPRPPSSRLLSRSSRGESRNLPATTIPPFLSCSIEASSRARSPVNTILIYKRSQYIYIHIHVYTHICVYIINLDLDSSRHAAFNRHIVDRPRVIYLASNVNRDGIEIRSFHRHAEIARVFLPFFIVFMYVQ